MEIIIALWLMMFFGGLVLALLDHLRGPGQS